MGDQQVAAQIFKTKSPAAIKDLGRKVKNWDEDKWVNNRFQIMVNGITLKCLAHPNILKTLLDTGDTVIIESSPFDRIWGVGITADEYNKGIACKGLNLLGRALMNVRKTFRALRLGK